ncbi:MAG TPA: PAS domain-containing protein [Dongiaceae bacterium]|nr:PAS domain-containing protein [Dongiaceae bacterium]
MAETIVDTWDFKDPSFAQSQAVRAGLDYWQSKRRDAGLPSRALLDPLEMRAFLAKILIIDVEADDSFVFRLFGTEISDGNRRDLTGHRADEASLGASAPQFIDAYRRCVRARGPIFFIGHMWWQDRGHVAFEQVMLPLSSDGIRVDKLLCVVDFEIFS